MMPAIQIETWQLLYEGFGKRGARGCKQGRVLRTREEVAPAGAGIKDFSSSNECGPERVHPA